MKFIKGIIRDYIEPIDTDAGALNSVPNYIVRRSIFMSWNASLQLVADVILELIILLSLLPFYMAFRLEFFFLAVISAVVAYLSMKGMRQGNLDVTRSNLIVGLAVEMSLVIADIYLIVNLEEYIVETVLVRLPFIIFTSINVLIILNLLTTSLLVRRQRPNHRF